VDNIVVIEFTSFKTDIAEKYSSECIAHKYGTREINIVKTDPLKSTILEERIIKNEIREYDVLEPNIREPRRI
jgi:hypothetical protein